MVGRLLLRTTIGGLFVGHGTQKLLGAFGGEGLGKTAELFEMTGMKPGLPYAVAAGVAETAGGVGLLLGQQTPLAGAAVIGSMATAIDRIHFKNGIWQQGGGYEYPAVVIAAAATLVELGPGKLSLDARKGRKRSGDIWTLVALGLGIGGAAGLRFLVEFTAAKPAVGDDPFEGTSAAAGAPATPAPAGDDVATATAVDDDQSAAGSWEPQGGAGTSSSTAYSAPDYGTDSSTSTGPTSAFDPQRPSWSQD